PALLGLLASNSVPMATDRLGLSSCAGHRCLRRWLPTKRALHGACIDVWGVDFMKEALPPLTEPDAIGNEIHALAAEIFPICRSITGDGVRETINLLSRHVPIERHELPTGTAVLDWVVPKEWNIIDAYILNTTGERVVDFRACNLHVVNYSSPVRQKMPFSE